MLQFSSVQFSSVQFSSVQFSSVQFSKIYLLAFVLLVLLQSPVFSKSKKKDNADAKPAPLWVTDEGRNQLFPKSTYVSVSALGSSASEAKTKAASEFEVHPNYWTL